MRRKKAIKRGRWASVFVAAVVGYALGSWNAAAVRSSQASSAPTAAQTVALRFPSDFQETPLSAPTAQSAAPSYQLAAESTVVIHNANRALFAPEPMIPAQPETAQAAEPAQAQNPRSQRRPQSHSGPGRGPLTDAAGCRDPRHCGADFAEAAGTRRHA